MPTFAPAPDSVKDLAAAIIEEFPSHQPVLAAGVKFDFVFAHADVDDDGEAINNAISSRGFRVLGQTKIMPLKDRAMGRGDAEIVLDADHWNEIGDEERKALLDHELHHVEVKADERGVLLDDLDRPKLKLRKHDVEHGFFHAIAARNGEHSIERIQMKNFVDAFGQIYLPGLCGKAEDTIELTHNGKTVTTTVSRFRNIAKDIAAGSAK